jgi:hypothetical protein
MDECEELRAKVRLLREALVTEHERMLDLWQACIFYARTGASWDGGQAADEALQALRSRKGLDVMDLVESTAE